MLAGHRPNVRIAALSLLLACSDDDGLSTEDQRIQEFTRTYCDKMFECDCRERVYSTPEACEHWRYDLERSVQLRARAAGLSYDDECARAHIEHLERTGCDVPRRDRPRCSIFYGEKEVGETCGTEGLSDCRQGLRCWEICYEPDDPDPAIYADEGAACWQDGHGQVGLCEPDQHCHPETHRCTHTPSLGEACSGRMLCQGGYCDNGLCVAFKAHGEACTDGLECGGFFSTYSICHEGVCTPLDPAVCTGGWY